MDTKKLARNIREDCLIATNMAKSSHVGSMLSIADVVAVLYGEVLRRNKKGPDVFYDKFILSKGHAGCAVFSALAELGIINKKELLETYYQNGSLFSGHVSSHGISGIELSTGSLGQGVCVANGLALARKMDKSDSRVFTIVGDGELNEGSVWEAVMFAVSQKLDNLAIIVDKNNFQLMGKTKDISPAENLKERFCAFGCEVVIIDGHNHSEIKRALTMAHPNKPLVIVANTIKGKGVSFMENNNTYHAKPVSDELLAQALKEVMEAK